jgi:uncharacterized membrane-anchored protein YhcB (DUF1043 family)
MQKRFNLTEIICAILFVLFFNDTDAQFGFNTIFKPNEFHGFIHNIYQDSRKYLWIASTQGIYLWDTKRITHLTVNDGLPHNETFKFCEDNIGRIWISANSEDLCYFLNGKIYNTTNDTRLKKFKVRYATSIAFNNGVLYAQNNLISNKHYDEIQTIDFDKNLKIKLITNIGFSYLKVIDNQPYIYLTENKDSTKNATPDKLYLQNIVTQKKILIHVYNEKEVFMTDLSPGTNQFWDQGRKFIFSQNSFLKSADTFKNIDSHSNIIKDGDITICYDGKVIKNLNTGEELANVPKGIQTKYLSKTVYILTKNQIYYQPLNKVGLIHQLLADKEVKQIFKMNGKFGFVLGTKWTQYDNKLYLNKNVIDESRSVIYASMFKNGKFYLATQENVFEFSTFYPYFKPLLTNMNYVNQLKYADFIDDELLVSSTLGVFATKTNKPYFEKRTSTFFKDAKNRFWTSTIEGLFYKNKFEDSSEKSTRFIFDKLEKPIVYQIIEDKENNLLFATNRGLYITKTDLRKTFLINNVTHLSSNQVTKIELDNDGSVWIATDIGLNHIRYNMTHWGEQERVNYFMQSDGLASNLIHDFLILGDSVAVATDKGASLITNKHFNPDTSVIDIYINECNFNNEKIAISDLQKLNYQQNNISIHFSTIYVPRPDRLNVYYKLVHDGKEIIQPLNENKILLQSLEPAYYDLYIFAYDKDYPYIKSKPLKIKIRITPPYYKTWWFMPMLLLIALIVLTWIIYYYFQLQKRKLKTHNLQLQLEHDRSKFQMEALKSEMNPHFIFNCLNSIQDYIQKNNTDEAQHYLSQFSKLMRKALHHSKKEFITLEEELSFIKLYVEMEQMRFNKRFDLKIYIQEESQLNIDIPTMFLQPIIENAIRHGKVGQLDNRQGIIVIDIRQDLGFLVIEIKDNGIGLKKAQELKINESSSHKSMALEIIKDRISLYNTTYNMGIKLEMNELDEAEFNFGVVLKYEID